MALYTVIKWVESVYQKTNCFGECLLYNFVFFRSFDLVVGNTSSHSECVPNFSHLNRENATEG